MDMIFWITILVLGVAVTYDILHGRIPNCLTLPAMAAGIIYHASTAGIAGFASSTTGLFLGFSVFFPFYLLGGMGAGDVKLMAALGTFLGPADVLLAAAFTAVAGGIYSVILLAVSRSNRKVLARYGALAKGLASGGHLAYTRNRGNEKATPLRYGVAIGAGTLMALVQRML